MQSLVPLLWFVLSLPGPIPAQRLEPCRRPHCTLAGEDLPLVLALADLEKFGNGRLRVAPGVELEAFDAAQYLWDRHRQGHGGWPGRDSSATLTESGLGNCDIHALDALYTVAFTTLGHGDCAFDGWRVARVLECNGRTADAERLLLAAIPPGAKPDNEIAWEYYAEFLVRRGRFEEALPLIELRKPFPGGCSLGASLYNDDKFAWVERCCDGMYGGTCDETLFEKRFEIVGIHGLAQYVAQRSLGRGSAQPERDAKIWFETTIPVARVRDEAMGRFREQFDAELDGWIKARLAPPTEDEFDRTKPVELLLGIARVRELVDSDPMKAQLLLLDAAETGSPIAGNAIRELVSNASIKWSADIRSRLMDSWRDSILTRTFGCADPEDPATW